MADETVRIRIEGQDYLSPAAGKAGQSLGNLDKIAKAAHARLNGMADGMSSLGTKMMLLAAPLVAVGVAATKMAMDAVESENLFEVSMGDMAGEARKFSEQMRDQLGLNGYEVRRQVGTWNTMLGAMGMGKDAAFEMAKGMTVLANDMASFYNMRPDEAFEKLQAGISGEIEPLKRLGLVINETTVKEYALAKGLIKAGEELSEQQKVMARYGLIMQQTGKAQGDLARTIESPTNQLRLFRSQLEETAIEAGQVFLPVLSGALNWITKTGLPAARDKLDEFKTSWGDMSEEAKTKVFVVAGLFIASGPLLKALSFGIRGVGLLAAAFRLLPSVVKTSVGLTIAGLMIFHEQIANIADGIAGLFESFARGLEFMHGFGYEASGLRGAAAGIRSFANALRDPKEAFIDLAETATGVVMPAFNALTDKLVDGAKEIKDEVAASLDTVQSRARAADAAFTAFATDTRIAAHDAGTAAGFVADQFKLLPPVIDEAKEAAKRDREAAKAAAEAKRDYTEAVQLLRGQLTALKDATDKYGASSDEAREITAKVAAGLDNLKANYADLSAVQQQEVDNIAAAFDKMSNKAIESSISVTTLASSLISLHPATIAAARAVYEWDARISSVNLALRANADQLKAAQAEYAGMGEQLAALNQQLSETQRRFTELSRPKLAGMTELEGQIGAIQTQLKRLSYAELTGLDLSAVQQLFPVLAQGSESFLATLPTTKEGLQKVLETLQLTQSLKFDEQLRLIAEAAEGVKEEMTFTEAMKQLIETKNRMTELQAAVVSTESAMRAQQGVIQAIQAESERLNTTLQQYQEELRRAQANQQLVTSSLQLAFQWLMQDREKFTELGAEGERVAGVMDIKTRDLLTAITQAATDTTGKSTDVLAKMVTNYQTDMALAMLEIAGLTGALEGIPNIDRYVTIHTNYSGGGGAPTGGGAGSSNPALYQEWVASGGSGTEAGFQQHIENLGAIGAYQKGGSFVVGGAPGIDRNLVSMLLTKGERVDITPAGRAGAGRGINLTFNIYTTVADEPGLRRFARQIKSEIDAVVEGTW